MAEKELANIVGDSHVLSSSRILEEYSGDLSFAPRMRPRCVVRPGNVEEVQRVVEWANETLTPLVPVSSGSPHFLGDTIPGVSGAVIVDFSRMKRVIRVDASNRVAIVEPGVTFGELQSELEKSGLCAYMPLLPRSSKSVIGSVLEREPITIPGQHWDATDPMLCMEVVFGTGDRLRTGEAAGPDTLEEQWEIGKAQMSPFGPTQMDVQRLVSGAQGTIGIVTWMSLKCRCLPSLRRAFLVPSESIEPLIDLSYKLERTRLGDNNFLLNDLNLACLLGRTPQEIRELRAILPPWILFIAFEGSGRLPEEKVRYQEADFREMARSCGLTPVKDIPGASAEDVSRLISRPSPEPYWKLRFKGGFHDIFFLTTLGQTPTFVAAMPELTHKYGCLPEDTGVYIQATVQGTSCQCEFNLYYNPEKPSESDGVRRLVSEGAGELEEMGGFFSRPYGAWADAAYRRAQDTATIQRKVKKIFDPNGILNPGKLCFQASETEGVK